MNTSQHIMHEQLEVHCTLLVEMCRYCNNERNIELGFHGGACVVVRGMCHVFFPRSQEDMSHGMKALPLFLQQVGVCMAESISMMECVSL